MRLTYSSRCYCHHDAVIEVLDVTLRVFGVRYHKAGSCFPGCQSFFSLIRLQTVCVLESMLGYCSMYWCIAKSKDGDDRPSHILTKPEVARRRSDRYPLTVCLQPNHNHNESRSLPLPGDERTQDKLAFQRFKKILRLYR